MDELFERTKEENIRRLGQDQGLQRLSKQWLTEACRYQYSYHFTWLGLPIIQFPQDIIAMQEVIWRVKPDLIVETGIARGGSLIFYASMLELIGGNGEVVGIDIDLHDHNRVEIARHAMSKRITMLTGSSVDENVARRVYEVARGKKQVLVCLDSNHTHEHVRRELEIYSPLVTVGSYLVIFDTVIEEMPEDFFPDRSWGKGDNPMTAVREFLKATDRFVIDKEIEDKLLITVAPGGYLRCVKS